MSLYNQEINSSMHIFQDNILSFSLYSHHKDRIKVLDSITFIIWPLAPFSIRVDQL